MRQLNNIREENLMRETRNYLNEKYQHWDCGTRRRWKDKPD
ncbi:hypothetical protein C8J48_0198 [Desmospora activa DSM 45169]|uniref:Uncharacterized protein n=1 Tax=Desmospora activa DSM 45169 TaxID=1121389 RepID=A0A2T4Z6X7_9BACL|nr:hypothetical protein C8J48_0198 [Desmospora activa DSM 45169]